MDFVNREEIERKLARVLSKDLRVELDKLLNYLGDPPNLANVPAEYWQGGWKDIQKDVEPILVDTYIEAAMDLADGIGIGIDWGLANNTAANWARTNLSDLLQKMFQTTYDGVNETVPRFFTENWTIEDLTRHLERWHSPRRAEMIATTETTRAVVEGERAAVEQMTKETGIELVPIWLTANDEMVCPVCGPRHKKPITDGVFPPLHPRCRCMSAYEPKKASR